MTLEDIVAKIYCSIDTKVNKKHKMKLEYIRPKLLFNRYNRDFKIKL